MDACVAFTGRWMAARHRCMVAAIRSRPRGLRPQAKSARERIGVVAGAATRRQFLEVFHVAAAQYHVIGLQRGDQTGDHVDDVFAPLLFAMLFQPGRTHVVLVGAFLEGQVGQLHRHENAVHHHRRAQARPQSQEQQLPPLGAAQGLQGRVVDQFDRAPERGLKVEADPARGKVGRLRHGAVAMCRPRVAD